MSGDRVTLRVLSYNVRSLRDDARAVACVIKACDADVACVQEAPRFFRWRAKCAALARESDQFVVTGGRPAGAMLLLSSLRAKVISTHDILLSKRRGLHQRGIAAAVFEIGSSRFAVASIHLDLEARERRRHVDEILAAVDSLAVPTIIAGDINEGPSAPAWRALAERHHDAYAVAPSGGEHTYSATQPTRRIDGVFVDPRIEVVGCGVPDVPGIESASDHRPVLAVLALPHAPNVAGGSDDRAVV